MLFVFQNGRRRHVFHCLISELEVLLERDRVLDLKEDNGRGEDESTGQNAPLRRELA